jgi:hypothetical protein
VDVPPAVGAAVSLLRLFVRAAARRTLWAVVLAYLVAGTASASERYVLVVAGAPGSAEHADNQARWLNTLVTSLRGSLGLPADHVVVLGGPNTDASARSTADNVRTAVRRLLQRASREDLVAVVLIGHGTWDGVTAKFNLVGPDLDASDWAALLAPLPSQVVVVNTTAASAPFLSELAGPRRVIVTATSSAAQRFDTVFAQFFSTALTEGEADLDKDERVSVWEAFTFASVRVKRHYEQRGQLATERALLDDTGDGVGKEAGDVGPDGTVASRTFLDAGPAVARAGSPALSELLSRRERLLADLDELKRKRTFMPVGDYASELERLLVDIARISQQIRRQS